MTSGDHLIYICEEWIIKWCFRFFNIKEDTLPPYNKLKEKDQKKKKNSDC